MKIKVYSCRLVIDQSIPVNIGGNLRVSVTICNTLRNLKESDSTFKTCEAVADDSGSFSSRLGEAALTKRQAFLKNHLK